MKTTDIAKLNDLLMTATWESEAMNKTNLVGLMVWDNSGTGIYGRVEYVTEDGWLGVRDESGRLDEMPLARAIADRTDWYASELA